ncbi:MAG: hypothetical protein DRR00_29195 [Candidatus Parabeggiatoa sp. nov. 3]|nr:MAG: hypothetical protein DRR00_29195 [Gammaproteobacteria bacterium]RKZ57150.1 MAG: hypothetical protein DRQ99_27375 [Gammaproteobacteria bacterium]
MLISQFQALKTFNGIQIGRLQKGKPTFFPYNHPIWYGKYNAKALVLSIPIYLKTQVPLAFRIKLSYHQ